MVDGLPDHSNNLGDWCASSGEPAHQDGGCPQGCRSMRDDDDDDDFDDDDDL